MRYIIKRLKRFCGFITGFVFFFSGILKIADPTGAGLVVSEYMHFMHIGFLSFSSRFIGEFFALGECIIGTALITGVWRKITGLSAMILQGFFTLITLALVIFNPEMDCGCFGEAIHISHTQTLIKNLILCVLLVAAFIPMRGLGRPKRRKYASFGIVTISAVIFAAYSWLGIPIIDFTEFKPGTALQAGNAFHTEEEDMYEAVFIYEKNGKEKTFTLENLPDSTWTFVNTETVLKEGFEGSTASLSFYDKTGEYQDVKACQGKVMIISIYNRLSSNQTRKVQTFIDNAAKTGFKTIILQSGKGLEEKFDNSEAYEADYKTLITLNRSNAGATYISDGYIICKWARKDLPDSSELHTLFNGDDTETIIDNTTAGSLTFQGFLLYVFAVMLLM